MYVIAEYPHPEEVASGISALAAAGFDPRAVELFSEKPVELPSGALDRPSRMSLVAVAGGILNGGLATAFIFHTQYDYPLVTGGMPLVSPWATGVITFELTMAGAVAGTILAFLWEAGLLRRHRKRPPVPRDGSVLVQVMCTDVLAPVAAECLSRTGAVGVTRDQE